MGRVLLLVAALVVGATLAGCTGMNDQPMGGEQTMSHEKMDSGTMNDQGMNKEEMGQDKTMSHDSMGEGMGDKDMGNKSMQ